MSQVRGKWFGVCAWLALLTACGGSGAAVQRKPAPRRPVEPVVESPREPSVFEQRWSTACQAEGAVGQCPAPFDRPGVFFDVGESEHAAPPFCGALEVQGGEAALERIAAKRKALKACFRGAGAGSYVELGAEGAVVASSAPGTRRSEVCVAKVVKRALAGLPQPERVVVLLGAAAKAGDQVLSKESLNTVIGSHTTEVSACYDAALEVWPGLKGRMAAMFVIWFDGRVALVRTSQSTLSNPPLECCINTAIRGWTFPKPSDGSIALVTFPFTLGPQQ